MERDAHRWVEVTVGSAVIAVHLDDPVATIDANGRDPQVVSWSDLSVGHRSVTSTVLAAPWGMWVVYRPMESEDLSFPEGEAAAVHVSVDGSVTRFTMLEDAQPIGATSHGLWMTSGEFPDPDDPTAWHQQRQLSVLATDGTTHRVLADRKAAFVFEERASAHLVVYDGPPDADRDGGECDVQVPLRCVACARDPTVTPTRRRRARRSTRRGRTDASADSQGARRCRAIVVSARTELGPCPNRPRRSDRRDRIREARVRQPRLLLECVGRKNISARGRARQPARRGHRRMATDTGRSEVHASHLPRRPHAPNATRVR